MATSGQDIGLEALLERRDWLWRLARHLAESGIPNEDGVFDRASVHLVGGTLAGTPGAACLIERMAAVLSTHELPQPIVGLLRFESWTWRPGQPPVLATPPPL